jgi:IclR family transcriptional regulator, acetate operon repressor
MTRLFASPDPDPPATAPGDRFQTPPDGAQTIARTLRTLELLAFHELSPPQLAAALQMHVRTARRVLAALVTEGYAAHMAGSRSRYRATFRLAALGRQLVAQSGLVRLAVPHVAALCVAVDNDAHLWVPSYRSVVRVLHADGTMPPEGPAPELGAMLPAHACAPGKVLLAHRDVWRENLLSGPLERFNERTIVSREELHAEIERIKVRGYGIDRGEHRSDICGLAAPVVVSGEAVAAVAVTCEPESLDADVVSARVTAVAVAMSQVLTAAGARA